MALPPEGEQAMASGSGGSAAPKAAAAEGPASGGPKAGPASGGPEATVQFDDDDGNVSWYSDSPGPHNDSDNESMSWRPDDDDGKWPVPPPASADEGEPSAERKSEVASGGPEAGQTIGGLTDTAARRAALVAATIQTFEFRLSRLERRSSEAQLAALRDPEPPAPGPGPAPQGVHGSRSRSPPGPSSGGGVLLFDGGPEAGPASGGPDGDAGPASGGLTDPSARCVQCGSADAVEWTLCDACLRSHCDVCGSWVKGMHRLLDYKITADGSVDFM